MPFDWPKGPVPVSKPLPPQFNKESTHQCAGCFYNYRHPHFRVGTDWNSTTTIVWECNLRIMRTTMLKKYDHRTRIVLEYRNFYEERFGKTPCPEKSILKKSKWTVDFKSTSSLNRASREFEHWLHRNKLEEYQKKRNFNITPEPKE